MTEDDLKSYDQPSKINRKSKRRTDYANIIYKMLLDGHPIPIILKYILLNSQETLNPETVASWVYVVKNNNFQDYRADYSSSPFRYRTRPDHLSRFQMFLLLTKLSPYSKTESNIRDFLFENFKSASFIRKVYLEFHQAIMNKRVEDLDEFLEKYKKTRLENFCLGLEQDYQAISNAIVRSESNGLTEGNNCKIKCIKRILYGRADLVKFETKAKLAFYSNKAYFDISSFLR